MQLLPSLALAGIVKHFLVLESEGEGHADHLLFSDGCPGMIFQLGEPFGEAVGAEASGGGTAGGGTAVGATTAGGVAVRLHPRSFLYGQISSYHRVRVRGRVALLAVVLQPFGLGALTGVPAGILTDQVVPLDTIWGAGAALLEERILEARDHTTQIHMIEAFLLAAIARHVGPDPLIREAISLIHRDCGNLPVSRLNTLLGTGERQLERKFVAQIGFSPKYYSGIVRLQYFLRLLRGGKMGAGLSGAKTGRERNGVGRTAESLTELAYACGYYDQAHLIREFQKHVGIAPRRYSEGSKPLAVNFIRLGERTLG
jgi:AraC-like DNA-binding protein